MSHGFAATAAFNVPYRRKRMPRTAAARNRWLLFEHLEDRSLLADLSLTSLQFIERNDLSTSVTPLIGEQVCILAKFSSTSLPAGSSYRIDFSLDGVPISANNVTSGAGAAFGSLSYFQCGWFASPGPHNAQVVLDADNTVAETDESNNTLASPLQFTPVAPTNLPNKFLNPLGGVPFRDWQFTNYVDVDPTGGVKDFRGGNFTSNGHDAVDIALPDFGRMDLGIPEYAAADGVVESVQDGNFDRNDTRGSRPANFIVINHGSGWRTKYYHLATNTITVRVGDAVTAGQFLGLVGSSGDSNGPHLHFDIEHNGSSIEPGYAPSEYYVSPSGYQADQPTTILDALVTSFVPTNSELLERPAEQSVFSTQATQNPVLVFYYTSLGAGEQLDFQQYRPDGTLHRTATLAGPTRGGRTTWQPGGSPVTGFPGTWSFRITKAGVELASRTFVVTTGTGAAQIRVTQNSSVISDNRTTAVDFGSAAVGGAAVSQTFTINNHGSAPLSLSGLVLPPGFAPNGAFPSSIAPGASSNFTVDLRTTRAGSKFGAIQFATNDPDTPFFNFNISGTVTGAAPAGSPQLSIAGPALAYTTLGQALAIKPEATVTDSDSATFGGGILTAEFTSATSGADVLSVQNVGLGAGQIGVSNSTVLYGSVAIGTLAGGANGTPLTVSLNNSATTAAVQQLVRSITFNTTATHPETLSRYVRFSLTDDGSVLSNQPIAVVVQNLRPTTVSIDAGGNLVITDSSRAGKNDDWRLERAGGSLLLTDFSGNSIDVSAIPAATGNATSIVSVPLNVLSATGQVIVDSRGGRDTLTIDLANGNPIPLGGMKFDGGDQLEANDNPLVITGGDQGAVTYNYTSDYEGSLVMSNFGTVTYQGYVPILNMGAADDIVFNLPATGSSAVLGDDGTVGNGRSLIGSANAEFEPTTFVNPTGTVAVNRGNASDLFSINGVPDFRSGLTIGSAASPFNDIKFQGEITFDADKSLTGFASRDVSLPNAASAISTSGSGSVALTAGRNISVLAGTEILTVDGGIVLSANQQALASNGSSFGIVMRGSLETSGSGSISLSGRGGNDPTTGFHPGVFIDGTVRSTGSGPDAGKIVLFGRGGSGTTHNEGVAIESGNANAIVESVSGDIEITGFGGIGSATLNRGVEIVGGSVRSIGSGASAAKITITGTGGMGTDTNLGVLVGTDSSVTSLDGDIVITGQGNTSATGSFNYGIQVHGQVQSTSSAKITLTGTGGGTGASGSNQNQGVRIEGSTTEISAVDGSITIAGASGVATLASNTFADGVRLTSSATIKTTGAGALAISGTAGSTNGSIGLGLRLGGTISVTGPSNVLSGDRMFLDPANLSIAAETTTVTLRPMTSGTAINLGSTIDTAVSTLALSNSELDIITANALQIGDAASGPITITADIARAAATDFNLSSGGAINFTAGSINTAGGNLNLAPGANASVGVARAGTDVNLSTTGTLSFDTGSDLAFVIIGTTVDTQYSQLNGVGTIDLTNVDLVLSGTYTPIAGNRFVLINNDGTDAVTGTFNDLPEGMIFSPPASSNRTFQITYRGGDGNDVAITAVDPVNPTLQGTPGDDNWLVKRNAANLELVLNSMLVWTTPFDLLASLTINGLDGIDTLTVDLSAGDTIPTGNITYIGGNPTTSPGDKLIITGGDQGTVTYNYSNSSAHDGNIVMSNYGTVSYTGLEPIVNSGTATHIIFNLPTGPSNVTLEDDGTTGNSLSRLSATTFEQTDFANPTGSLQINRINALDTIALNALPDFNAALTLGSASSPLSAISFVGSLSLAADKGLAAFAFGVISLTNSASAIATSGTGGVNLTTARNIVVSPGASISTVNGDLIFSANQQATRTSGNFSGITLNGTLTTTGTGNITLVGLGGNAAASASHRGIDVNNGVIRSTSSLPGAGKITLIGTGGAGTDRNTGVVLSSGDVESVVGDIQVTGTSGTGSTTFNRGIAVLDGSQVKSTGTGDSAANITFTGTGGAGTNSNFGVEVYDIGTVVSAVDGDITLIGNGGTLSTGSFEYGVFIGGGGVVKSTGTGASAGNIVMTGTGGGTGGSGADQNQGVRIDGADTEVVSADGSVDITGIAGPAVTTTNTFSGVRLVNGGAIHVFGAGRLTLSGTSSASAGSVGYALRLDGTITTAGATTTFIGDTILLNPSSFMLNASTNTVALRPKTLGRPILLGIGDTSSALGLASDELNTITAGTLEIGDSNAGPITVVEDVSCPPLMMVGLTSGGGISFADGGIYAQGATLLLTPGISSSVSVPFPNVDVFLDVNGHTALAFADGSSLTLAINGKNANTEYDQLDILGDIDLTGVNLVLSGTYAPAIGDQFLIVNNRGGDSVIGEFNGLHDGEIFHISTGALTGDYIISYHDGDGNDVVITAVTLSPTLASISDPSAINEGADQQQINLSGIAPGFEHSIVGLTATSSNPSLIPNPTVDYQNGTTAGSLSFTPLPDQFGSAVITVTVKDDGPAATNNFSRTFTVVVNPVNDPPSFTSGANQSAFDEHAQGPALEQVVLNWATNVMAGPSNESAQHLTFHVANDNHTLFAVQPAIDSDGKLRYTPQPNAHGMATLVVTLQDDASGADTSPSQQFTIEIKKLNKLHNAAEAGSRNGRDVTGSTAVQPDGFIVANDVLAVINFINAKGSGAIPASVPIGPPYVDVNGDGQVVAQDVLDVINWINAHPGQTEAEAAPASLPVANNLPNDLISLLALDIWEQAARRRRLQ